MTDDVRRWAAAAFVVGVVAAHPAAAQDATAAARSFIQEQNAEAYFEPLPNANARLVKHKKSGMFCIFAKGDKAELQIFDLGKPDPGDDVGCVQTEASGAEIAMFAARVGEGTPERALGGMVRSMNDWGGWTSPPTSDEHKEITAVGGAAAGWPRAQASFRGVFNGRPIFVRLAAARSPDKWMITERVRAPLDAKGGDPERLKAEAHMMAETAFAETLRVMAEERKAGPT